MLYFTPVWPWHTPAAGPLMALGLARLAATGDTFSVLAVLLFPQPFTANTLTVPALLPIVTVILVAPCPDVIDQPAGTSHKYDEAPETGVMEKVADEPTHMVPELEIEPGALGLAVDMLTKRLSVVLPQSFFAVRLTLPPVVLAFTVISVVPCPEVIVQPVGTVQV